MGKTGASGNCPVCGFDLVCAGCAELREQLAEREAVIERVKERRIGDLRSLKTLASMTGSLATVGYCDDELRALLPAPATEGGEG